MADALSLKTLLEKSKNKKGYSSTNVDDKWRSLSELKSLIDDQVVYRNKSNLRCTRAKQARVLWDLELTKFVYSEAHKLRKLRNNITGFDWHVDHIIPLKGVLVCGLHVWNNFAVIPKVNNLRKGNNYPVHD